MKCKIKELCKNIGSGGTPSRKNKSFYINGEVKWLKTKELLDNKIYDAEEKITENALNNSSAKVYPVNTISMAMYGATVGQLGIFKTSMATNQACCNMVVDEKKADYRFLFYALLHNRRELRDLANGAAQQNLNKGIIENFEIDFYDLNEQKVIADTLSSLDDKIELNNKINENLEKQAQAIFKHWFVDFEFPDEDGKPYKSSGGEMVESELGLIPKGWEVKTTKDFLPVITGKKNANIATKDGKYKFFTCAQEASLTDCYSFEGKAILVAGNGDFNVKFYNGRFEAYQRTYVLIPEDAELAGFIYYMIKYNLEKIIMNARGSVISYLTKGDLENSMIAYPPGNKCDGIINILDLINTKILSNRKQNQTLSQLRDTLLPKLMSGEIRIPFESKNDSI